MMNTDHQMSAKKIASELAKHGLYLIPQPKEVQYEEGTFKLSGGIRITTLGSLESDDALVAQISSLLNDDTGLAIDKGASRGICVGILQEDAISNAGGISSIDMIGLGDQGYMIDVKKDQISILATEREGLFYGLQSFRQMVSGRKSLPVMRVRDWPSMENRGVMYDISRGQMPHVECLMNMMDILSIESKCNVFELYIEDTFKWKAYPDIACPEAMSPLECRRLFEHGKLNMMDVHPMMQVLGHFSKIGDKSPYQKYMVRVPSPNTTVDIRKPEAVQFVSNLVDEICTAFPAEFLNVDVTEIDDEGFRLTGTSNEELPDLVLQYIVQLNEVTKRHGTRLMVAQSQLGAEGHLNGLGKRIDKLPRDIAISSYYTAEFYGGWDHDFPLLKEKGIDFFANCWIDSHGRIMPYVGHAMDFSDITIRRGLQYGCLGSVTTDWGDYGHYHLPGVTIYPFMYHCASAWCGADIDRDYFDRAFCRVVFGAADDSIAKAISLVGNINGRPLKIRNENGEIETPPYLGNTTLGWYFEEFFANPFTDTRLKKIADLEDMGNDIIKASNESVKLLEHGRKSVSRNKEIIEQLLFAARNYQAMGKKLLILSRYNDPSVPRPQVAKDLLELADFYESLRQDFRRLWLTDCKDAGTFAYLCGRFDETIAPCREMASKLVATE